MKPIATSKTLIMLQYYGGDEPEAMELARLIADIQQCHSTEADFLFLSRFDCPTPDAKIVKEVSRKFNTFKYTSPRRGTGWPLGCNELFVGGMEWIYGMKKMNKIPQYKTIFAIESDCVPMSRDWIARLKSEWYLSNQTKPVFMAGAWLPNCPQGNGSGHINGNAIMSGDMKFMKWLIDILSRLKGNMGWDYALSQEFKGWGWAALPGFTCAWHAPMSEATFLDARKQGCFWWHGVKGFAALNLCRKHLL